MLKKTNENKHFCLNSKLVKQTEKYSCAFIFCRAVKILPLKCYAYAKITLEFEDNNNFFNIDMHVLHKRVENRELQLVQSLTFLQIPLLFWFVF